jgi:cell volume regulation protein A
MINLDWILLALSSVVLLSYVFDIFGQRVRIPSVVMLIASGMGVRIAMDLFGLRIEFVDMVLPIVGTLGLVLIVLEGALELHLTQEARGLILRAGGMAVLGIVVSGGLIAAAVRYGLDTDWYRAWLLAIPFAVISSAVAIPAAESLLKEDRETVVYESALSDIVGVLVFYALLNAQTGFTGAILGVVMGISVSAVIGGLAALLILVLLVRIESHVRFVPMIFGLVMVYSASKLVHLAPLVSVMAVGLMLNNAHLLANVPRLAKLMTKSLYIEIVAFKQLTVEFTFVVRTFFFLLLGYSTAVESLALAEAWIVTGVIVAVVFLSRKVLLKLLYKRDTSTLFWFAPRGLITILLYLNIPEHLRIDNFPNGTLMLTVLATTLILTVGLMRAQRSPD